MKKVSLSAILFLSFFHIVAGYAQVTNADYARVDTILARNNRIYSAAVDPHWTEGTTLFWYVNKERTGDVYYLVDASTSKKERAFNQERLAAALTNATGEKINPDKLPVNDLRFISKNDIRFKFKDADWSYTVRQNKLIRQDNETKDGAVTAINQRRGHQDTAKVVSPDGQWEAFIRDHNVYFRVKGEKDERPLTMDGAPHHYYSSRLSWSPDSKKLATLKIRDVERRRIPLIESAPASQRQPILHWQDYAKPGDVLPVMLPVLFDIEKRKEITVDASPYTNQYWLNLTAWREDNRGITFEYNERGHQRYIVGEINASDGSIRHIADEQTKTFIHYYKNFRYDMKNGDQMLWISERDGWRHLYLYDAGNGSVIRQITKGEWVVREVQEVDEEAGLIYFTASGLYPTEDPYNIHYCRINFDGEDFFDFTPENANHKVTFSSDKSYFVDAYSRPDLPPVSLLKRSSDGKILLELEKCDISDLLAEGWQMPEVFHAKGRDGKTDIWGNIHRPTNFDPSKSYPVIEMIYAGPHDSHVDKIFKPVHHLISKIVDLGFIVVSIDGMGTSNRSKAFHDVCWKNLKDAGFPDRIRWMQAAAAEYPYMDISKVGIYGWSAGGQNAMAALLFHNDFYKVAVSFCGCHDNRMDKIWWNEQWMGYPLDESYSASSNVDNAHLLKGKLLLINGELDTNVDPTSTLQVVDALVKANKHFEQLYLPSRGHSLGGPYEMRRMSDFFVKHVMGQEPPEWE